MNLTRITSADLTKITKLVMHRESIQAQIAQIDAQLAGFDAGGPGAPIKAKPGRKKAKQAKRGAVKAAIIDLVKGAGAAGITVKKVAAKIGGSYNRVSVWFTTTGRNIKEIKKIGPGKYAWAAAATPAGNPAIGVQSAAQAKAVRAGQAVAPVKPKASTLAVANDTVISLVKGSGKAGIKKVGPAKYAWVG